MLSKAKIKLIKSLELKKFRDETKLFVAEGPKVVDELLKVASAEMIVATQEWASSHDVETEIEIVDEEQLRKLSFQKHPQQVLAVFPQLPATEEFPTDELCLALDGIQDPGNLGTIIRIADWFGIAHIFCSKDCVDVFNPKTVQATMGSLARVNVSYTDLLTLTDSLPSDFPVYATLLDGDNIYDQPLSENGLIVMGNEGKGISMALRNKINRRLLIPSYPTDSPTAESLNVAIATAIVCAEFRRRS